MESNAEAITDSAFLSAQRERIASVFKVELTESFLIMESKVVESIAIPNPVASDMVSD